MTADKAAKVSNMFRFGMQLVMPKSLNRFPIMDVALLKTIVTVITLPIWAFIIRP